MNYELAKELKDAGFPLKYTKVIYAIFDLIVYDGDEEVKKEGGFADYAIMPTLSELIEACGDRFIELKKSTKLIQEKEIENCWRANGLMVEPDDILSVEGGTPEEAVARLWLVLNKK